jgi:replicative DNA helicase
MGKTAMALSLCLELIEKGLRVKFISAEMPIKRIIDRLASYYTGISTRKITKGELNGRELNEVLAAVESINKDEKIILSYSVHFSKIKRELSMDDYDIAMVDYLQLITPDVVTERRLQIANISRGIKQLAVMKDKPIILLSQVNRKTTDAPGKRPGMENLAESAAIEQDADNIAFLHRPSYYLDEELKEELTDEEMADTEIIIAKQRDGLRTTVKCIFSKGRFYEGIKEEKNDGTSPF